MSGQTPVERAAGPLVAAYGEALRDPRIPHVGQHAARAALAAALDVDELAEELWASVDGKGIDGRLYRRDCDYLARVLKEHLTRGDENDE